MPIIRLHNGGAGLRVSLRAPLFFLAKGIIFHVNALFLRVSYVYVWVSLRALSAHALGLHHALQVQQLLPKILGRSTRSKK